MEPWAPAPVSDTVVAEADTLKGNNGILQCFDEDGLAPQAQEPHLYILDTGFVSTAMDVQHMHHKQTGDQKMLRHRLAKHGTGATSRPSTRPPTRPPGATRPTPCLLVRQARCSAWRAS